MAVGGAGGAAGEGMAGRPAVVAVGCRRATGWGEIAPQLSLNARYTMILTVRLGGDRHGARPYDRHRSPNPIRQNIGAIIRPCGGSLERGPGIPPSLASPDRASVSSDRSGAPWPRFVWSCRESPDPAGRRRVKQSADLRPKGLRGQ